MDKADITIIGAGLVGLAIAAETARPGRRVLLVERHARFGQETSSRNSQVIHAGIYYPPGYLKGRLCVEGNRLLYALCAARGIPHRRTGKLVVAVTAEEEDRLPDLLAQGRNAGADGLEILPATRVRRMEPRIRARAALYCPSSGIVDTHRLMEFSEWRARQQEAEIVYGVEVVGIEHLPGGGYVVRVQDRDGCPYEFATAVLINSAGLNSGHVAALAGIDQDAAGYRIQFKKGIYARVGGGKSHWTRKLIYPMPTPAGSVGVHTVPDLAGEMKLGPYDAWVSGPDYSVDEADLDPIYESVRPFLPFIQRDDLGPDMAAMYPKVQKPGQPMQDFIITHEAERGLPGLIDLVGIESPGVTAFLAIGRDVARMAAEILGD